MKKKYFDGKNTLDKEIYYNNGNIKEEYYYLNDNKHREDGPSIIYYNDGSINKEYYYLNGKEYNRIVLDCEVNRILYKNYDYIVVGKNLFIT